MWTVRAVTVMQEFRAHDFHFCFSLIVFFVSVYVVFIHQN